jgi:hypothetical protein
VKRETPCHAAIWIDAHEAILVAFDAEPSNGSALHRQAGPVMHLKGNLRQA